MGNSSFRRHGLHTGLSRGEQILLQAHTPLQTASRKQSFRGTEAGTVRVYWECRSSLAVHRLRGDFVVGELTVKKTVTAWNAQTIPPPPEHIEAGRNIKVSSATSQIFVDLCELPHM